MGHSRKRFLVARRRPPGTSASRRQPANRGIPTFCSPTAQFGQQRNFSSKRNQVGKRPHGGHQMHTSFVGTVPICDIETAPLSIWPRAPVNGWLFIDLGTVPMRSRRSAPEVDIVSYRPWHCRVPTRPQLGECPRSDEHLQALWWPCVHPPCSSHHEALQLHGTTQGRQYAWIIAATRQRRTFYLPGRAASCALM